MISIYYIYLVTIYFEEYVDDTTDNDKDMDAIECIPKRILLINMGPDIANTQYPDYVYNGSQNIKHQNYQ